MKRKYLTTGITISLIALSITVSVRPVLGIDLLIEDNGSGSSNAVEVTESKSQDVQQSNQTQSQTDAQVNLDSGDNEISDTTGGDNTVTTGDVSSEGQVTNEGNVSQVENIECCDTNPDRVEVSGNGSDSQNRAEVNRSSETNINVEQDLSVDNEIRNDLNSGNNEIEDSQGDSRIQSGDISESLDISVVGNTTHIRIGGPDKQGIIVKVMDNGSGSDNVVVVDEQSVKEIVITNLADVRNEVDNDLNTGFNVIDDNNGEVLIVTGRIDKDISIETFINNNTVIENCGVCEETTTPPPTPTPPPAVPPSPTPTIGPAGAPGAGGPGGGGPAPTSPPGAAEVIPAQSEVLGAVSEVLPVTGSRLLMLVAANIITLLLGCYLRLLSGRAPNFKIIS